MIPASLRKKIEDVLLQLGKLEMPTVFLIKKVMGIKDPTTTMMTNVVDADRDFIVIKSSEEVLRTYQKKGPKR